MASSIKLPIDLEHIPIHVGKDTTGRDVALPLQDFTFDEAAYLNYIATHCQSDPGRLLSIETSTRDWEAWECHRMGVEIVIILEGKGRFFHLVADEENGFDVGAGDTVINPAGVWHTMDVYETVKAIYLTPCPGTEHRQR